MKFPEASATAWRVTKETLLRRAKTRLDHIRQHGPRLSPYDDVDRAMQQERRAYHQLSPAELRDVRETLLKYELDSSWQ